MRQLQIIWFCSLKQNYNLLKQEPKQMLSLYQGYIVLKGKLHHKSSAFLQEKKNSCILLLGIHSVENITNSRSGLIHKFRNPWETFTSAHKFLVSGRLCVLPAFLRDTTAFKGYHFPSYLGSFVYECLRRIYLKVWIVHQKVLYSGAMIWDSFLMPGLLLCFPSSSSYHYPYVMVKTSITKVLNCGLRHGLMKQIQPSVRLRI